MNKSEFITALQAKTGLAKADVTKLVNAYGEVVIEAVSKGEDVRLIGFGTFEVRQRKAREGRNPHNNEPIQIEASKTPAFKAGKQLKDLVNNK